MKGTLILLVCLALIPAGFTCAGKVNQEAAALLASLVRPGVELTLSKPCGSSWAIGEPIVLTVLAERSSYLLLLDFFDSDAVRTAHSADFVQQVSPSYYYSPDRMLRGGVAQPFPADESVTFVVSPPQAESLALFAGLWPIEDLVVAVVCERPISLLPAGVRFTAQESFAFVPGEAADVAGRLASVLSSLPHGTWWALAVCYYYTNPVSYSPPG
jgi:hypothetical protein